MNTALGHRRFIWTIYPKSLYMKYLIPSIVSLVVGSLFSWAYLTAYGFGFSYIIYLSMMIAMVFLAIDAWRNINK